MEQESGRLKVGGLMVSESMKLKVAVVGQKSGLEVQ